MATVPVTRVEYTGNGVITDYAFPFEYEDAEDVKVEVDGVIVTYTFATSNIVSISPAPVVGADIVIYRDTPAFVVPYIFASGVPFLTKFADSNWRQLLYIVQEFINDNILNRFNLTKSLRTPDVINELPDAIDRADKIVAFDADGQPVVREYLDSSIPGLDARVTALETWMNGLLVSLYNIFPRKVNTWADIATTPVIGAGQLFNLAQHTANGIGGGKLMSFAGSVTDTKGTQKNSATSGYYLKRIDYPNIIPEFFGFTPGYTTNSTIITANGVALLDAIAALRKDPVTLQQHFGGSSPIITAYASGTVVFGNDVYVIPPDVLNIQYDMGLRFLGQGCRGVNNAIRASSTLLSYGTSSGFVIYIFGNGARNFRVEKLDVCYGTSGHTGDVIDHYDAPGLTIQDAYIGTYGYRAGERLTTARSLLRQTYDEHTVINNVVFSGFNTYGWWDDTTRNIDGVLFGGSDSHWHNVAFYDGLGTMMYSPIDRVRETMTIDGCAWNPINVDCVRALDLQNVVNLKVSGFATPSTTHKATTEWVRLLSCVGTVNMEFGGLSRAGTFSGNLTLNGCLVGGTDGFILVAGVIRAFNNKFVTGTNGYQIANSGALLVELGPDTFNSGVTTSYYLPVDSTSVRGKINYSPDEDASSSKFEINSARVRVKSAHGALLSQNATTYSIPFTDSGITTVAGASANQTYTLSDPKFCVEHRVSKISSNSFSLTVNAPAGKNFLIGSTTARTSAVSSSVGAFLEFTAINANTYILTNEVGAWVYT